MKNTLKTLIFTSLFALAILTGCDDSNDPTNDENEVEITVTGVEADASIMKGAIISINIDVDDYDLVDKLDLMLNGNVLESFTSFPAEYTWNTFQVDMGEQIITFQAYLNDKEIGSKEFTIEVTEPLTVTDYDGNVYHTVQIGSQIWMVENLKATYYRNGDAISSINAVGNLDLSTTGGYCNYDNNASNGTIYGKLYNFYAVEDSREIAPEGWHVPTQEEYKTLLYYLGGADVAGGKMKEAGSEHWNSTLTTAVNSGNNESGFTALPGGMLTASGDFSSQGYMAYFWTIDGYDSGISGKRYGYARSIGISTDKFYDANGYHAYMGMSVRCVKD
ncbi:MAG: fibrobacter succinogenes major paralogous domain-containing protein [Bacteroidales bacterium]|nr:fibrobacter succinogenes major paralogous domain-containing protein [Bacteroidales bacterium]